MENLKSSLVNGSTISEINMHMRLVMKSLVIDPYKRVIGFTFADGSKLLSPSRAFMAIEPMRKTRKASFS